MIPLSTIWHVTFVSRDVRRWLFVATKSTSRRAANYRPRQLSFHRGPVTPSMRDARSPWFANCRRPYRFWVSVWDIKRSAWLLVLKSSDVRQSMDRPPPCFTTGRGFSEVAHRRAMSDATTRWQSRRLTFQNRFRSPPEPRRESS